MNVTGEAEVNEVYLSPKIGMIVGCTVTVGFVQIEDKCCVVRDGQIVYNSTIATLRHFKSTPTSVKQGQECGLTLSDFDDVKVGDKIVCYYI